MQTCLIPPDSQGFNVLAGNSSVSILLDGGGPRVRQDQLNVVSRIGCQWTCNPEDFNYMMAFYRTGTSYGTVPFQIELVGIDSSTPAMYVAQVVAGTWKLASQEGLEYTLQTQLWVMPLNDTSNDAAILAAYA